MTVIINSNNNLKSSSILLKSFFRWFFISWAGYTSARDILDQLSGLPSPFVLYLIQSVFYDNHMTYITYSEPSPGFFLLQYKFKIQHQYLW